MQFQNEILVSNLSNIVLLNFSPIYKANTSTSELKYDMLKQKYCLC